jgi:hypothetical protein
VELVVLLKTQLLENEVLCSLDFFVEGFHVVIVVKEIRMVAPH